MPRMTLRRSATLAALASALVASTLSGCTTAPTAESTSSPEITREAAAYRASRVCVVNESQATLFQVSEAVDMPRTGPTHPDPTGPLATGATWCTNGYNSFTDDFGSNVDATVEIQFSDSPTDRSKFMVGNPAAFAPWMTLGFLQWDNTYWAPGGGVEWERDVVLPRADNFTGNERHDVHLRRADDSSDFIEWIVTVRS